MYMVGIGGGMAPALKIIDGARKKNLDITHAAEYMMLIRRVLAQISLTGVGEGI
jgi:hypothetical protein